MGPTRMVEGGRGNQITPRWKTYTRLLGTPGRKTCTYAVQGRSDGPYICMVIIKNCAGPSQIPFTITTDHPSKLRVPTCPPSLTNVWGERRHQDHVRVDEGNHCLRNGGIGVLQEVCHAVRLVVEHEPVGGGASATITITITITKAKRASPTKDKSIWRTSKCLHERMHAIKNTKQPFSGERG